MHIAISEVMETVLMQDVPGGKSIFWEFVLSAILSKKQLSYSERFPR
jgi:hypothetical protein